MRYRRAKHVNTGVPCRCTEEIPVEQLCDRDIPQDRWIALFFSVLGQSASSVKLSDRLSRARMGSSRACFFGSFRRTVAKRWTRRRLTWLINILPALTNSRSATLRLSISRGDSLLHCVITGLAESQKGKNRRLFGSFRSGQ